MMTRNAWPIGPAAICGVETSSDGGATWAPAGSFTVDGGEVLGKDGSPVTVNRFHFSSAPGAISRYWVTPLANIETSISVSGV